MSRARFAMSESNENRYDFYSAQYARFGSGLAAEIRREVYGTDFGQQGWRTLDEQDMIVEIVGERPSPRLLDVACGSGGPSLAIASAMTGCHVTGVDIEGSRHSRDQPPRRRHGAEQEGRISDRRLQPASAVRRQLFQRCGLR